MIMEIVEREEIGRGGVDFVISSCSPSQNSEEKSAASGQWEKAG